MPAGYSLGRDWLAGNATNFYWPDPNPLQFAPTPTLEAAAGAAPTMNVNGGTGIIAYPPNNQVTGQTSANGYTYQTIVTYVTGLLGNTSTGVNHYLTVEEDGRPAFDGLVAVLVVSIVSEPSSCSKKILGLCVCEYSMQIMVSKDSGSG